MVRYIFLVLSFALSDAVGQTTGPSVYGRIDQNGSYLFYLHGAVVSVLGDNAINQAAPEWGPYEYSNILDSLQKQGFHVVSEIRQKDVDDSIYVNKISKQIDSLLNAGVKTNNILLVGASAGWAIVLRVSSKLKNGKLKYVMMGGCWKKTFKDYQQTELWGQFLSIIETSDPHGTCFMIFENRSHVTNYQEIVLNTGLSHGFFYKGRKVWIEPLMKWYRDH